MATDMLYSQMLRLPVVASFTLAVGATFLFPIGVPQVPHEADAAGVPLGYVDEDGTFWCWPGLQTPTLALVPDRPAVDASDPRLRPFVRAVAKAILFDMRRKGEI